MRRRVVIVGGGFGGLQCAKALGDAAGVEVVLVDRENHHCFQPLLYQVATASLAPGEIAVPIRSVLGAFPNVRVVLGEAQVVDFGKRVLVLSDGERISYDWLVLAAGAKTNHFGRADFEANSIGLKNLRDALKIRERVLLAFEAAERVKDVEIRRRLLTFVVIGGGPTGVEMAGAISELGRLVLAGDFREVKPEDVRVVLVEMADRLLTPFVPELSKSAEQQLRELSVELRLGTRVEAVEPDAVVIAGERIHASVVVWASGVKPASLAARLGVALDRAGRVRVDGSCAVLGHAEVFAIGDIAAFLPEGEEVALPGLAPVAIQQGRFVARQIRRELHGQARERFEYVDKGIMATVGRSRAVAQSGPFRMRGFVAWVAWCLVHILYLIGFRNRLAVLFEWAWSYVTFKRGARLITAHVGLESLPSAQAALEIEHGRNLAREAEEAPPAT